MKKNYCIDCGKEISNRGAKRCTSCAKKGVSSRKHTIEFVKSEFEKEGYTLISTEYFGNRQKLEYICPKKHICNKSWANWIKGSRCNKCGYKRTADKQKFSIEFIREQFEKEGYILISTEYKNNKQKLDYICPEGHEGSICWGNWERGQRCRKCWNEKLKGKNNPNWRLQLTDEHRKNGRNIPGYKEWRTAVFEQADYTCEICGDNTGGNLNAHHLEDYENNPKLRTTISNGVCLCETCHKNFHHQYGYGKNTEEQFEEFKCQK